MSRSQKSKQTFPASPDDARVRLPLHILTFVFSSFPKNFLFDGYFTSYVVERVAAHSGGKSNRASFWLMADDKRLLGTKEKEN